MTKLDDVTRALINNSPGWLNRGFSYTDFEKLAHAAVEAMRVPTDAMVDAAPDSDVTDPVIREIYSAMIYAILNEKQVGGG